MRSCRRTVSRAVRTLMRSEGRSNQCSRSGRAGGNSPGEGLVWGVTVIAFQ
ncbi:hypothetical protein SLI_7839 [Streptomyces lividans 1326]|uniref:Uncharacterized protein n=1 Tax=Streptomyces lividans 1326 TaxID=1200984 RepID=A0A7U9E4A1_STRLI|nr:hypothetical protein SLI_7839 [Streptomyces lividans 1326]